jgi:N-acetylmuramoyl-L-alanine amidase
MLSPSGASSEAARWLAEKENAADLIGGISLNDKEHLLASVLFDLSQSKTLEASAHAARQVLKHLKKVVKVHLIRVQRANFLVLRAPDIPSILIETGFMSNLDEEQRLNNPNYRKRLAAAIFEGIIEYFARYAPVERLLAHR